VILHGCGFICAGGFFWRIKIAKYQRHLIDPDARLVSPGVLALVHALKSRPGISLDGSIVVVLRRRGLPQVLQSIIAGIAISVVDPFV